MINENEQLWQTYREEMSKLLQQLEPHKAQIGDATFRNVEQFLEDMMCSHYIHLPKLTVSEDRVVLRWSMYETTLVVEFLPNNEWDVSLEKTTYTSDGPEPSFWLEREKGGEKEPFFHLEDRFLNEIERKQEWSQVYEPMTRSKRIMWCTGYWDGPLSGYCTESVGNDMYYFECVEELPYSPRTRMYAVYELSPQEQIDACFAHARWIGILKNSWRWWLYLFSFRLFRSWRLATSDKRQEAFRKEHKLIGYFTN